MTKLTTVEACCGCPWAQCEEDAIVVGSQRAFYTCQHSTINGLSIFDHEIVPGWCPLEDVDAQTARIEELEAMLRRLQWPECAFCGRWWYEDGQTADCELVKLLGR